MIDDQLRGACGGYREYGVTRHFRVRGMSLTFQFINLKWNEPPASQEPTLREFTFLVSIVPDPTATSATSERTGAARPPKSCLW
jgi:hypothetical protein